MDDQARLFYRLVDVTENSILDADYYTRLPRSLDELDVELGLFPDNVDLRHFREVLLNEPARQQFFEALDLSAPWSRWQPHLRAIDELLPTANVTEHVKKLVSDVTSRDPLLAARLLVKCQEDAKMYRVGGCVGGVLAGRLQSLPAEVRSHIEEALLSWAVDHEEESWDVDPDTGEITALGLRWQMMDLSLDVLPAMLWKLVGVLHARLSSANGDIGALLARFNWCMTVAKGLPLNPSTLSPALRLVTSGRVPSSVADSANVLRERVSNLQALDDAVLDQFGLPLWPFLSASYDKGKITLQNRGIGVALRLRAAPLGTLFTDNDEAGASDLPPDGSIVVGASGKPTKLDVRFSKFGREHWLEVPVSYAKRVPIPPIKKQLRKRSQRDATVGALKRELHERILWMKSALRNADDTDKPFDLPRLTQKELAAAIKASESSVSRAIAESNDRELQIMLQTVEDPDMIRKYSR